MNIKSFINKTVYLTDLEGEEILLPYGTYTVTRVDADSLYLESVPVGDCSEGLTFIWDEGDHWTQQGTNGRYLMELI